MVDYGIKCNDCGKFMDCAASGVSTACMYDLTAMEYSHDHWRCNSCTQRHGPVRSNARPHDGDMTPYQTYIE